MAETVRSAGLKIRTADEYRRAVEEVQRLQGAREGSREFERRQALRGAMHEYESRHMRPICRKGRPGGSIV